MAFDKEVKHHSSQGYLEDGYCCKEGKEKKEEGDQSCTLSVSLQVKWKCPPTQCGNLGLAPEAPGGVTLVSRPGGLGGVE